ncbi:hypothetical protein YWIDRAFT_02971 [Streptomyces sp. SceaMP-e96]|nr:hypothetical protein YWIDRAFT_02971 [Streptomyces sp. SceaMP-e96]
MAPNLGRHIAPSGALAPRVNGGRDSTVMEPITATALAAAALVAKGALESAGGEAGRSTWQGVTQLVERIRQRFGGDADATAALGIALDSPDDEQAVDALRRLVHAYMLRDPQFEADVTTLVHASVAAQASKGTGSVNAAVIKNATTFNEKVEFQGDFNIN